MTTDVSSFKSPGISPKVDVLTQVRPDVTSFYAPHSSRAHLDTTTIRQDVPARSAGFQTCCIADFQVGRVLENARLAGLETRDTADLEVCATVAVLDAPLVVGTARIFSLNCLPQRMEYQRENGFAVNRRVRHENN
jgi:hypothetical protein